MKRQKIKKGLALLLSMAMIFSMSTVNVFATEGGIPISASSIVDSSTPAICENHKEHDKDCGYVEAIEGTPCGHLNEDGSYSCAPVLDSDVSDNNATPSDADEEYVCDHADGCGYTEAAEGADCTHECELCKSDKGELQEQCSCKALCTESQINPNCPVCAAEGADLAEMCKGKAALAPECNCTVECTAGDADNGVEAAIKADCPVCGMENADLAACKGEAVMLLGVMPLATDTPNGTKITTALDFTTTGGNIPPADCTAANGGGHTHTSTDKCFTWEDNTLTLNNLNLETSATVTEPIALKLPADATVEMNGTSTVTSTYNGSSDTYGIYGGALNFSGSGSLTATGGQSNNISYGVNAYKNLAVSGGTLTATGGQANNNSYGVVAVNLTVSGGTLTAIGGTATGTSGSIGSIGARARSGNITVSGGTFEAKTTDTDGTAQAVTKAPTADKGATLAITGSKTAGGALSTVSDLSNSNVGTYKHLKVVGTPAPADTPNGEKITTALDFTSNAPADCTKLSTGAHTHSKEEDKCFTWDGSANTLTLNNLTLETSAATAIKLPAGAIVSMGGISTVTSTYNGTDSTFGINGASVLTFNGSGSLTANGGQTKGISCGVYARGNITVSSGTLTATSGTSMNSGSYGVYAGNITVSGGALTATGGQANNSSIGAYAGNITVESGTLTANGGTATTGNSYGAYSDKNLIVSGTGTLTAIGDSYGVKALNGNLTVSGGTFEAKTTDTDGTAQAVTKAPVTSGYTNVKITASTTADGTMGDYDAAQFATYKHIKIEQGTATSDVAEIGTTGYPTLAAAVATVKSGDTIKLLASITGTMTIPESNALSFTLDLNGKTLNGGDDTTAIKHQGTGTLTIKDGASGGKVTSNAVNYQTNTISLLSGSAGQETLSIIGGTVESTGQGVAVSNRAKGTVNVSGGTVDGGSVAILNVSTGEITVTGGKVNGNTGNAIFNQDAGPINIGGTAIVTSANTSTDSGTIELYGEAAGNEVLKITGGTVENTAYPDGSDDSKGGIAIFNKGSSKIAIKGGEVTSRCITDDKGTIFLTAGSLELSGGEVVGDGSTSGFSTAIYTTGTGTVTMKSGTYTIQGNGKAMNKAPTLDGVTLIASTDVGGANPVTYNAADITTYKYLKAAAGQTDAEKVAAAKTAAQNASYPDMPQASATDEATIENTLKATAVAAVDNSDVSVTITKVSYTPPVAGTAENPAGTNGSYTFTVDVKKGLYDTSTDPITITITATAYTAQTAYTITFNPNGGSVTPTSATTGANGKLAGLPTPTHSGSYRFDGWYTAASGGTQVTAATVFNQNSTIYAHWTYTGGGDGSSSGGRTNDIVKTDQKKGHVHSITGIITGSDITAGTPGDGYSHWQLDAKGRKLQYADGTILAGTMVTGANGAATEQPAWELINSAWYAFGADGYAKSGLVLDPALNGWFYIDLNTGMKTGWQLIEGKWRYFNPVSDGTKGKMAVNTKTPDGYFVDRDGVCEEKNK